MPLHISIKSNVHLNFDNQFFETNKILLAALIVKIKDRMQRHSFEYLLSKL
jgi:hypothetical protein